MHRFNCRASSVKCALLTLSLSLSSGNAQSNSSTSLSSDRKPAMSAARSATQAPPKPRQPAAVQPVQLPTDRTLPKSIPIYPGATSSNFKPNQTPDNRSNQVALFYSKDPIEKVAAFYSPKVVNDLGKPGLQVHNVPPQFRFSQGWFTTVMRGPFTFRVLLMWPVYLNPQAAPVKGQTPIAPPVAHTEIKFFMERR